MPKYSWTIETWSAVDGIAIDKLTEVHAARLDDFQVHDVVSALKGEVIPDYIPETPVMMRLLSKREDRDGTMHALVHNLGLPKFYTREDRRDGNYIHLDVHTELADFIQENAGLISVTGDTPAEVARHVD